MKSNQQDRSQVTMVPAGQHLLQGGIGSTTEMDGEEPVSRIQSDFEEKYMFSALPSSGYVRFIDGEDDTEQTAIHLGPSVPPL